MHRVFGPFTITIFMTLALVFVSQGSALADPPLLSPTQLSPELKGTAEGQLLDRVFSAIVHVAGSRTVTAHMPSVAHLGSALSSADVVATVVDPTSSQRVLATDVVQIAIAAQQSYYRHTGVAMPVTSKEHPVNIDDLVTGPIRTTVTYGAAAPGVQPAAMTAQPPGQQVVETSVPVALTVRNAPSSASCPAAPNGPGDDPSKIWDALKTYLRHAGTNICALGSLGGAIRDVGAHGTAPLPIATAFPFGNPATAEGVFTVTPALTHNNGVLKASLDANFGLTVLSVKQASPLMDAIASVSVPSSGDVTSEISVTGSAMAGDNFYDSKSSLGPASLSFHRSKTVPITLFTMSQSWPIGPGTVTASVDVRGQAQLDYDLDGDNRGLMAKVTPSLTASVVGSVYENSLVCTKCGVFPQFTVQDSTSNVSGLIADVPYGGVDYSVERLYAHYGPPEYQATIEVSGHVFGLIYFHKYLMQSKPIPLGKGFDWDSGWGVQPLAPSGH